MSWFTKRPDDGIYRERYEVKYGGFKSWWTDDQERVIQFKSNQKLNEEDYSEMEETVKKQTGASWVRIIRKYR